MRRSVLPIVLILIATTIIRVDCFLATSKLFKLDSVGRTQPTKSSSSRYRHINSLDKMQMKYANQNKETNTEKLNEMISFTRILPYISLAISLTGVCFQVFVLYPWHEELSYEFKTLETSIMQLDKSLEARYPRVEDLDLKRITDKYTSRKGVETAGPRISDYLPVFKELREMRVEK